MAAIDRRRAVDEFVVEPLVIPLTVVVREFRDRPPEMTLAERDHAVAPLGLDRAHKRSA